MSLLQDGVAGSHHACLSSAIAPRSAPTPSSAEPSEAIYHLFREVNDHLRATEEKHLQVSIGFIGATALALSFLVTSDVSTGNWEPLVESWARAIAYFVLILAGCMTMFAQHTYRGWKKEYLLASKKLVYSWPISNEMRVNWMRTDRGPYAHGDRPFFRLAGDNVLFWFVLIMTSGIVSLLSISLMNLLPSRWLAALLIALGGTLYLVVISYIIAGGIARHERLENNWDEFCKHQRSTLQDDA